MGPKVSRGRRGSRIRRRTVTLLVALTFSVLAVSGVIAFLRPFTMSIVGLHALMGFVFILVVGFHVANNFRPLKAYLRSWVFLVCAVMTSSLASLFFLQPAPVKAILGLSGNLGPAQQRFEMTDDKIVFNYTPADHYKMVLTIKTGKAYAPDNPPHMVIWLENQGAYHIKTLHQPAEEQRGTLPYWAFKVRGWEKAKREAEAKEKVAKVDDDIEIDAITMPTPNGSFDPADYILPADQENPMPYKLLIEVNQPDDPHRDSADQPSLVYSVEIDNSRPRTFQLLEIVGYPQREDVDEKEAWSLYYVDQRFGSALELIDSALLTIERQEP